MAIRKSRTVVQQLLDEMDRIVRDYHPDVGRTGRTVGDLIQGTSLFPGGCGLWRGDVPWGPMPEFFPESPVMLVAHNFDSIRAHEDSKTKGGEVGSAFWRVLISYMVGAGIDPADVFFTNALMGCKPGSAIGHMPTVTGYKKQCLEFLARQIEIVEPSIVVALGLDALPLLRKVYPGAQSVMHPSARQFNPLVTRADRIRCQVDKLSALISGK